MNYLVSPFIILAFIIGGVVVYCGWAIYQIKRSEAQYFRRCIELIKKLRRLVGFIQKHRGLTTGFINGNRKAKAEIDLVSIDIESAFSDVQATGGWIKHNIKWDSITDHWSRLRVYYLKGESDGNFKQHNLLIANLLYLIDDIADTYHLTRSSGDTVDTDWRYLLSIAEYIGQIRALGTGVAAKGECSSVARVQLTHLCKKIASSVDSTWPNESRNEIYSLLYCIETQLLGAVPLINPDVYFALATRGIERVLSEFDRQIDSLDYQRA